MVDLTAHHGLNQIALAFAHNIQISLRLCRRADFSNTIFRYQRSSQLHLTWLSSAWNLSVQTLPEHIPSLFTLSSQPPDSLGLGVAKQGGVIHVKPVELINTSLLDRTLIMSHARHLSKRSSLHGISGLIPESNIN